MTKSAVARRRSRSVRNSPCSAKRVLPDRARRRARRGARPTARPRARARAAGAARPRLVRSARAILPGGEADERAALVDARADAGGLPADDLRNDRDVLADRQVRERPVSWITQPVRRRSADRIPLGRGAARRRTRTCRRSGGGAFASLKRGRLAACRSGRRARPPHRARPRARSPSRSMRPRATSTRTASRTTELTSARARAWRSAREAHLDRTTTRRRRAAPAARASQGSRSTSRAHGVEDRRRAVLPGRERDARIGRRGRRAGSCCRRRRAAASCRRAPSAPEPRAAGRRGRPSPSPSCARRFQNATSSAALICRSGSAIESAIRRRRRADAPIDQRLEGGEAGVGHAPAYGVGGVAASGAATGRGARRAPRRVAKNAGAMETPCGDGARQPPCHPWLRSARTRCRPCSCSCRSPRSPTSGSLERDRRRSRAPRSRSSRSPGVMGDATEQLARAGSAPASAGCSNATFGNAAELIIALVALAARALRRRQGEPHRLDHRERACSVLGASIVAGGMRPRAPDVRPRRGRRGSRRCSRSRRSGLVIPARVPRRASSTRSRDQA
mgnify:CR=1 FL=1